MSYAAKEPLTAAPAAGAPPDGELVARMRAGDDQAFRLLVDTYWDRLFRLVHGIVGDWHTAEDVVQDVLVLVYRKIGGFNGRSTLLTWLYRIAVNAALKARRRRSRQAFQPLAAAPDRPDPSDPNGRDLENAEVAHKLLRCLPPKLRAIVLLREWEGLGYEDIGRVLGTSRGAVEQRLHRALVELRKVWKPTARAEWFDGL